MKKQKSLTNITETLHRTYSSCNTLTFSAVTKVQRRIGKDNKNCNSIFFFPKYNNSILHMQTLLQLIQTEIQKTQ